MSHFLKKMNSLCISSISSRKTANWRRAVPSSQGPFTRLRCSFPPMPPPLETGSRRASGKMNNKRQRSLLTHWEWFLSLTLTLWKCYVYIYVTQSVSTVAVLFRIWGSHQVRQTWCCYFSHLKREILSQCGLLTLGNAIHNMLRNTCKEEGQVSLDV